MATLIKTDGSEEQVRPESGTEFTLDELYRLIGNGCDCVQAVPLDDEGNTLWCDEEGKYRDLQPNLKATEMLAKAGGLQGDIVMGNVLIERGEVG